VSRVLPAVGRLALIGVVVSGCLADPLVELRADIPLPEGYVATELAQLDRTRVSSAAEVIAAARLHGTRWVGSDPTVRLLHLRQLHGPGNGEPTWIILWRDTDPPPLWGLQNGEPEPPLGKTLSWVFLRLDGSWIGASSETEPGR
jgi:hypothetical protein